MRNGAILDCQVGHLSLKDTQVPIIMGGSQVQPDPQGIILRVAETTKIPARSVLLVQANMEGIVNTVSFREGLVEPSYSSNFPKHLLIARSLSEVGPSQSLWSSPTVMVRKKDGSWRFCVDFRKVNSMTHRDAYPLPRIDFTLDTLKGSTLFTTLDLASGYWQVEVKEEDKEKTAFSTEKGHYEFNKMPFGLTNAPATFQHLMECVLAGIVEMSVSSTLMT